MSLSYLLKASLSESYRPEEGQGEEGGWSLSSRVPHNTQSVLGHCKSTENSILRGLQAAQTHIFESQASYSLERFAQACDTPT